MRMYVQTVINTDALKEIPAPEEVEVEQEIIEEEQNVEDVETFTNDQYIQDTRIDVKPTLWERIKNMKLIRSIRYVMKIKVVLELPPALPEGKPEGQHN